uniref:BTB domain-containing protein n=1 Tax=Anopheles christyi TaxID=43041 RepID=A0A182K5B9_9DIPT
MMASGSTPAYHCIVCTLTKIPFASLSKDSQQKIVRTGRPVTQMPNLTSRCLNSLNLHVTDWMTGCDRERKLFCWPCLLFNTTEYDVWGKRGFTDFHRLATARTEHEKNASHHAKSKTLKLWIESAFEQSDSSGEEDVECIPELDFLNMSASELDEEIDVKPNVEALNASIAFSQALGVTPVVDLCETAKDGSGPVVHFEPSAIVVDCEAEDAPPNDPGGQGENSQASNSSSTAAGGQKKYVSFGDDLARIYKNGHQDIGGDSIMSHTIQTGAEKYQLKWHSHYQNMNVSLSNLYKNDRYADVMLLTCNGEDSCTIPAHKLILGTSSLYFANIFDKNPVPLNAVTYIVLPPDLTNRSMQILIQYMYTGESTVSTDILNEVLRGGEILKIRGLWRNDCPKPTSTSDVSSGSYSKELHHPSIDSCSGRFVSPVTVTIPSNTPAPFKPHHVLSSSTGPLIHVKRDMAIDPGEVRQQAVDGTRSRSQYSLKNQDTASQRANETALQPFQERIENHRKEHEKRQEPGLCASGESDTALSSTNNENNSFTTNAPTERESMPQELNFLGVKAEPVEWSDVRAGELAIPGNGQQAHRKNDGEASIPAKEIKSEDCNTSSATDNSRSSSSSTEQPTYSPLTCELCSETFTIPGEWVRHIEGHSDTSQTLPKRRRRAEESEATDETAALRCDLCATFYVTPADWVRHVQNAHTESELAACNKRVLTRKHIASSTSQHSPTGSAVGSTVVDGPATEKLCNICNKSFPSYASMIIHRRTHTGDLLSQSDGKKRRSLEVFTVVGSDLLRKGFSRTEEQIRKKMNELRKRYFEANRSEPEKRYELCDHYDALHDLFTDAQRKLDKRMERSRARSKRHHSQNGQDISSSYQTKASKVSSARRSASGSSSVCSSVHSQQHNGNEHNYHTSQHQQNGGEAIHNGGRRNHSPPVRARPDKFHLKQSAYQPNLNNSLTNLCKLVLGTFSPYFANVFEKVAFVPSTATIYVALPPTVTRAALQCLLQYMYTGEAIVHAETLDDVMMCGEFLRINGFSAKKSSSMQKGQQELVSVPLVTVTKTINMD